MNEGVTTHHQLLLTGPLPWWLSMVVIAAILVAALILLRGEIRARRRPVRAAALLAVRTFIIVVLGLLLCQPVIVTRREERRAAAVKIIADRSRSMLRVDAMSVSERVRTAAMLRVEGVDAAKRPPAELARELRALAPRLADTRKALFELADDASQGIPSGPAPMAVVAESRARLAKAIEQLAPLLAAVSQAEKSLTTTTLPAPGGAAATQPTAPNADVYDIPDVLSSIATQLGDEKSITTDEGSRKAIESVDFASQKISRSLSSLGALQELLDAEWLRGAPETTRSAVNDIASRSRFELARRLAKALTTDPAVAAKHRVELVGFDDLTKANATPRTDLFADLEHAGESAKETPPAGVVLLTDGRQTLPDRPEVAARLTGRSITLLGSVIGAASEPADVAMADVSAPLVAPRGKSVDARVTVKTAVPAGTDFVITVSDGDRVLASVPLKATGSPLAHVPISFRSTEKFSGPLTFKASLPQPDAIPENDSARVSVTLLERTPRALLVAPSPDWQTTAIMRSLTSASARVDTVLWQGTPKDADKETMRGKFPGSVATAKRYETIVLAGAVMPGLGDADFAMLASYVEREGGRLIIVDENTNGYVSRLSSLLGTSSGAASVPAGADYSVLAPPDNAIGLPAVSLALDPYQSLAKWRSLARATSVGSAPAQSLVLLATESHPIVTVGFVGKGRVYAIAASDLWRLGEWNTDGAISRLFSGIAEESLVPTFTGAETVAVYPRTPVAGSAARVLLLAPAGSAPKGTLSVAGQPPLGLAFTPPPVGAAATQPSDGPDKAALMVANVTSTDAVAFTVAIAGGGSLEGATVLPVYGEDLGASSDEAALKRIVSYANGESVVPDELARRIAELPARVDLRVDISERRLWNAWWLLVALATLWTVEWVLRRRSGMAL